MTTPRYQALAKEIIPVVELPDNAGHVRVIAGEFSGKTGPAKTFSPVSLWDVRLRAGATASFMLPEGHTTALFVRHGKVVTTGGVAGEADMLLFTREGRTFTVTAEADSDLFLMAGAPLNEPVVGHGPFVMNTVEEIRQAITDVQSGRFGRLV